MQSEYRRDFEVTATRSADKRTVELSFSSELPVSRGDIDEVLSHDPKDIDLSRLNAGHPVLLNHDLDRVVGKVERAWIGADRKGRALVRFGRSQVAEEAYQNVRDQITTLCSVGYRLVKELSRQVLDNGRELVRYAWQPYEISLVSVPADPSVGVGRSAAAERLEHRTVMITTQDNSEETRVNEIRAICTHMADRIPGAAEACQEAIASGTSVRALRDKLFTMLPNVTPVGRATVDVPDRLANRYSLTRAIHQMAEGRHIDGLEKEMSDEVARVSRKDAQGFWVPHSILCRANNAVGTASLGGNLVATNLLQNDYISILRNRSWVAKLGARFLDGLVGKVNIPRQKAAATAYWEGEAVSTTLSNTAWDHVTLTPKAVTGYEVYSKMLLMQSTPSVDALIRDDLLNVLALAIDKAILVAEGTGQGPTALPSVAGTTTVTVNAAGAIPSFANILALEAAVAAANADVGNQAYLTNSAVRSALKQVVCSTVQGAAGFIWEQGKPTADSGGGTMNGYRAEVTNQLASNNTVGTLTTVCSTIYFGNWQDLIIGSWGAGTDLVVDPYTNASTREVRVFASQWVDIAPRHPESFSMILDALSS